MSDSVFKIKLTIITSSFVKFLDSTKELFHTRKCAVVKQKLVSI